jgi:hypothetical protein
MGFISRVIFIVLCCLLLVSGAIACDAHGLGYALDMESCFMIFYRVLYLLSYDVVSYYGFTCHLVKYGLV